MKTIIFIGIVMFLISGCSTYYPSEVIVDNLVQDRVNVEISKNNTRVDITISEKPRGLIKYQLTENNLIQLHCWDDFMESRIFNHSILWNYDIIKAIRGNSVYSYPTIEATKLQDILHINDTDILDCRLKGYGLELDRIEYVDGILISNDTEWADFDSIFGQDTFKIVCDDYIYGIDEECEIDAPQKLKDFIEDPRNGAHIWILDYIIELR